MSRAACLAAVAEFVWHTARGNVRKTLAHVTVRTTADGPADFLLQANPVGYVYLDAVHTLGATLCKSALPVHAGYDHAWREAGHL